MTKVAPAVCVSVPLVPVIISGYVPEAAVFADMLNVAVVDAGFGEGPFSRAFAGSPLTLSITALEKPPLGLTITL